MKRFKVRVDIARTEYDTVYVTVDADTAGEAMDIAVEQVSEDFDEFDEVEATRADEVK